MAVGAGGARGGTLPRAEILSGKKAGISVLWVLNEIIQKKNHPENMKKIVGAVWKLPAGLAVQLVNDSQDLFF